MELDGCLCWHVSSVVFDVVVTDIAPFNRGWVFNLHLSSVLFSDGVAVKNNYDYRSSFEVVMGLWGIADNHIRCYILMTKCHSIFNSFFFLPIFPKLWRLCDDPSSRLWGHFGNYIESHSSRMWISHVNKYTYISRGGHVNDVILKHVEDVEVESIAHQSPQINEWMNERMKKKLFAIDERDLYLHLHLTSVNIWNRSRFSLLDANYVVLPYAKPKIEDLPQIR